MDFITKSEDYLIKKLKIYLIEIIFHSDPEFHEIGNYVCLDGNVEKIDLKQTKITKIGVGAFMGCVSLSEVIFPDTLQIIENNAFCNTILRNIYIPQYVETMINSSWNQIKTIESFVVHEDNQYFSAENGCLYNKDKTILYRATNNITSYLDIPHFNSLKFIRGFSLTCVPITCFIAEKSLESVEPYSFHVVDELKILDLTYSHITELPRFFILSCKKLVVFRCPILLNSIRNSSISETSATQIIIFNNLEILEDGALYNCSKIQFIVYYGSKDFSSVNIAQGNTNIVDITVYATKSYLYSHFAQIEVENILSLITHPYLKQRKPIICSAYLFCFIL